MNNLVLLVQSTFVQQGELTAVCMEKLITAFAIIALVMIFRAISGPEEMIWETASKRTED